MLNVLAAERVKLKRNKLLLLCSITAILLPLIVFPPDEYDNLNVINWVFRLQMAFQLVVYPVLSGFIITFLIQKEYGDQTIINTLTAPVGRVTYLLGKLIVWFIWHIAITLCFGVIMCFRVYIHFGESVLIENLAEISITIPRTGILSLMTLVPIAWITVLQRKAFYPSLLITVGITVIGLAGLLTHGMTGSIIPWCAVTLICMPNGDVINIVAYSSIILCSAIGFGLAIYSFKKQQL